MPNSDYNEVPQSFYSNWNLSRSLVSRLDEWALWKIGAKELERYVYKTLDSMCKIEGAMSYELTFHILYKGKLFTAIWQNEALPAYIRPQLYGEDTVFIISFREFKGERVALVQRDRSAL